jgi:hypothetical protein
VALCGFGQFSGLVGNGLLAGRDPQIETNSHSFPHSDNVRLLYAPVAVSPTSILSAFSMGAFSHPFCIPHDSPMSGPVRQSRKCKLALCRSSFCAGAVAMKLLKPWGGAKSRGWARGPKVKRKLFETLKTHTCEFRMGCSITAEGSYFGDGANLSA